MAATKEALNPYAKNEESANRNMCFVLLFTAVLLSLVFLGYVFKLFGVSQSTYIMTVAVIPVVVLLLCTPMFYIKTDRLSRPNFKYYVLFLFVFAIGVLNVIMPKHGILGWAVCIALTGHYYNPKVCRIMFITVLSMLLVCLTLGTFFGEFDSNLLTGELDKAAQTITNRRLTGSYPDTAPGRWQYLNDLIRAGDNRYLQIYTNYFVGRALFITLTYSVIWTLNKRTYNLLADQITVTTEFQRSRTELEVAKEIQINTLPTETVSSKDVQILADLKAAKEVGGDLYDYLDIDENHVAILIGDVSGKGVPAAMFMMKTITSFRDFATAGKAPSQILREINSSIHNGNKTSMFVTCFLAILDKRDGTLVYANAGHNPPVIGSNKNYRFLKCSPGFLLGCFKEVFAKDEQIVLRPGECILLYTDGITEARNLSGEFFGENRLIEVLNRQSYASVVDMHHSLKDEISHFVGAAPQSDDITFLILKYHGGHCSFKEERFQAKKENMPKMLGMIKEFGEGLNFPSDFTTKLVIVGDELLSNIIHHGYGETEGDVHLRLLFDENENEFSLTVIDHAKPFNQLEAENPNIGTGKEFQQIGGFGIHIVKQIMTEYSYDRLNDKNILVLKKKF